MVPWRCRVESVCRNRAEVSEISEISVECSAGAAGLQCTARPTLGGTKAKACWKVEIRCQNGTKAVAPACAEVRKGQATTVTVAEDRFNGLEACDESLGLEVVDLTLE
jgi:acetyl-CoA acetyltransferase